MTAHPTGVQQRPLVQDSEGLLMGPGSDKTHRYSCLRAPTRQSRRAESFVAKSPGRASHRNGFIVTRNGRARQGFGHSVVRQDHNLSAHLRAPLLSPCSRS